MSVSLVPVPRHFLCELCHWRGSSPQRCPNALCTLHSAPGDVHHPKRGLVSVCAACLQQVIVAWYSVKPKAAA